MTLCTKLVSDLREGKLRPEYLTLQQFECADDVGCYHLCKFGIESLAIDDGPLYSVERLFDGDVYIEATDEAIRLRRKERVLYRLSASYIPF